MDMYKEEVFGEHEATVIMNYDDDIKINFKLFFYERLSHPFQVVVNGIEIESIDKIKNFCTSSIEHEIVFSVKNMIFIISRGGVMNAHNGQFILSISNSTKRDKYSACTEFIDFLPIDFIENKTLILTKKDFYPYSEESDQD